MSCLQYFMPTSVAILRAFGLVRNSGIIKSLYIFTKLLLIIKKIEIYVFMTPYVYHARILKWGSINCNFKLGIRNNISTYLPLMDSVEEFSIIDETCRLVKYAFFFYLII